MTTFANITPGDPVWVRYLSNGMTNYVAESTVEWTNHDCTKDVDKFVRMTGMGPDKLCYVKVKGHAYVIRKSSEGNVTKDERSDAAYYTDKNELIRDLELEKERFTSRIDKIINVI